MSRSHRSSDLSCKVYVGNLTRNASQYEVEDAFAKYGPLRNVWVARNPPGFAFIEFEDPRDAEDAVRALDDSRLCGTRVRVELSNGRSRRGGGRPGGGRGGGGGRGSYRERERRSPAYRRGRSRSRSPRRDSRSRSASASPKRSYDDRRRSASPDDRRR